MGGPGSLFSYGCAWANFSNTPLWLYKHYTHEGGIRTPMIAHWPAKIVGKGEWRTHLTHITDIMATCIDISGAHYPETVNNRKIAPYEGRSLLPAFTNQPEMPRTLVFEHERNGALREGEWKLVGQNVFAKNDFAKDAKWELYNISMDASEQTDLAKHHPERVEKMKIKLLEEARRTHILPKP
jgi:arylsulfatase